MSLNEDQLVTFIDTPTVWTDMEQVELGHHHQVIFLDIDGVLNSIRTCVALGGYGRPLDKATWDRVDNVAVASIRAVSKRANAPIVLSSTWRKLADFRELGEFYNLNIIDRTKTLAGIRGEEIEEWLSRHPGIDNFAIIDDDSDMLESQMSRLVKTCGMEGFSYQNMTELCKIFGFTPHDANPRRRKDVESENSIIIH